MKRHEVESDTSEQNLTTCPLHKFVVTDQPSVLVVEAKPVLTVCTQRP